MATGKDINNKAIETLVTYLLDLENQFSGQEPLSYELDGRKFLMYVVNNNNPGEIKLSVVEVDQTGDSEDAEYTITLTQK